MSGTICNDPCNSVLFDGVIPILTGLDGNMWARQLLTFRGSRDSPPRITFNFSSTYNSLGVIEVVVFNCPSNDIGTSTILITSDVGVLDHIAVTASSCQHFERSCTNEGFYSFHHLLL